MGFLKKSKAPGELPDLAIGRPKEEPVQTPPQQTPQQNAQTPFLPPQQPQTPKPITSLPQQTAIPPLPSVEVHKTQVAGEDYLEFSQVPGSASNREEIKQKLIEADFSMDDKESFFDKVLEDINGEIQDLGKLEEWYESKFLQEDVISNMKDYWEGNKADIIIRSFGSEYKQKIQEKIKILQELEGDWREIYFKLIKKEEEMKKEERILKETLSEFVDLCKRRRDGNPKKEKKG